MFKVFSFFSNIAFMFDVCFIFIYEFICFKTNGNYVKFIHNVANKLSKKNILYVKAFQAVSLDNNLIDSAINSELLKYTDSAPYTDDDVDYELLMTLIKKYGLQPFQPLGKVEPKTIAYLKQDENIKLNQPFLKVSESLAQPLKKVEKVEPINSGMISLVYKMTKLDTNKTVVLKIKRKNIDQKLDDAIEKLLFTIYLISYIPYLNTLNIPLSIKNNILLLRQQLDFHEEIKNTIEMAENCKHLKYIKIPKIHQKVTAEFPNVIVMEYIQGTHISKLNEADYEQYAKLILKYGFVSLINNSVTHGDLHAGNILFIKNDKNDTTIPEYQIGIIDFGIVIRINKKTTELFLNVVPTMFSQSGKNIIQQILENIIEPPDAFSRIPNEHKEKLYNELGSIIDDIIHKSKEANQTRIYEILKIFNEYLNNHNLKKYNVCVSDDFIKIQMALAMSHGASMCLCKNDYITFANNVLNELFHTNLLYLDE